MVRMMQKLLHHKKPTVADILSGWPPGPAGTCDLCSAPVEAGGSLLD